MRDPTWPPGARCVLHVDMDAFYASVEERENPALAGKPLVVGGPRDARGVVSAASYAARRYGVHSAMPLRTAARLCPGAVFLPVRMDLYQRVSRAVFGILERFSPLVEPLSVDEAFLDLTGSERLLGGGVAAARAIREAVAAELRLTASVGVAENKFVAKIASDLRKPDALVVVPPAETRAFLAPLPIERMWGIGARGAEALRRGSITTLGDLACADPRRLRAALGRGAENWIALATGRDARPVACGRGPRSVGHETTFAVDVSDEGRLLGVLASLVEKAAARLRRRGLRARGVSVKVRYAPFETVTRQKTLPTETAATRPLLAAAREVFSRLRARRGGPVRLLGVSLTGLGTQTSLLEPDGAALDAASDAVRARFGAAALRRGSVLAWSQRARGPGDRHRSTGDGGE